jgi:hypothetical protein
MVIKLIFRILHQDPAGNPVFEYRVFPPGEHFDDCRGPGGASGRLRLFRILFEILIATDRGATERQAMVIMQESSNTNHAHNEKATHQRTNKREKTASEKTGARQSKTQVRKNLRRARLRLNRLE